MNRRFASRAFAVAQCARLALALASGAAIVVAALPAAAEKADRDQPIQWSTDAADVNYQTKGGTLTGNVVIMQGTLTIRAERVIFRQNADNTLAATAFGNPVAIRQKREGHDEYFEGFAQRAEYDGAKDMLELFDQALLRRGADELRSNYVSYNTATEFFKAESRSTPGAAANDPAAGPRVRGVFQPKAEPVAPNAPPKGSANDATPALRSAGTLEPRAPGTQ